MSRETGKTPHAPASFPSREAGTLHDANPPALRLDAGERAALSEALRGVPGEVWLFGSRADPARRGGDIDLLVLTDRPAFEVSRSVATRFFLHCEEKIDVVVMDPARLSAEQEDFLSRIGPRVRLA